MNAECDWFLAVGGLLRGHEHFEGLHAVGGSREGEVDAVEAIFTNPDFVPLTGMLEGVEVRGPEHPDARVWVVGNAGDARANVPVSIGQGAAAGGDVAFALLMDEIAAATTGGAQQ
ncbi:hypothetical protein [Pseudoclavibacter helvolus]|uniref:hypothetical protein n=1 Tax=Pseudoclavibacter helvolus TaxID=255205 RepID=UPI000AD1ABF8|nr:hypothetical protein [Pseudoclavibacter helvolus]